MQKRTSPGLKKLWSNLFSALTCTDLVMRHATRLHGLSAWARLDLSCDPAPAFCCIQSASFAKQAPVKPKLAQTKASQKATETKAASKAGRDSSAAVANQRVKLMLDALMPQERPRPQRSAEDLADAADMARNFSRLKMQQHRQVLLLVALKHSTPGSACCCLSRCAAYLVSSNLAQHIALAPTPCLLDT